MKNIGVAFIILFIIMIVFEGCNAQDRKNDLPKIAQDKSSVDNTPKESWRINKEMDEDGNITKYDSTYTWSYSNLSGDSVDVNVDSVLNSFNNYFNQRMPSLWGPGFRNHMWGDSALFPDYFRDDYFHNRWKNNLYDMDNMFKQMDSMRNKFYNDNFPGMMRPHDNNESK